MSAQAYGPYFEQENPQERKNNALVTNQRFGETLVAGRTPERPAALFQRLDLPTADDPRAQFRPTVWWPTSAVPLPPHLEQWDVREARPVDAGQAGIVFPFVRSDWSEPFAVSALPLVHAPSPAL